MLIDIGLTLVGLALLVSGADFLVRGAASVALRLGVSTLLIGLTVVALGTSLPEVVVSLRATLGGAGDLAFGNVVGSNIANVLLILGVAIAIATVRCRRLVLLRDGGAMLVATLVFIAAAHLNALGRVYGVLALIMAFGYLIYSYRSDRHAQDAGLIVPEKPNPLLPSILTLSGGLVAVVVGGDLLVRGAIDLARIIGISEEVIGLTLVAFGTSLPELAATTAAAARRHGDMALGNVLGSNILNLLLVMGLVTAITPLDTPAQVARFDLWVMGGVTFLLILIMAVTTRIPRLVGVLFILSYIGYILFQVAV